MRNRYFKVEFIVVQTTSLGVWVLGLSLLASTLG
jgi:hypothetical protein